MSEEKPFLIPVFPQDERPRYVPPLGDFEALHALATGKDHAMLLTALHTAARRGEIFRLTWDDVDFTRGIIRLGTRKRAGGGMQYDWLPMTGSLSASLSALYRQGGGYIFPRADGERYKVRTSFLRKMCAQAGVRRFGFHSIRHLSASLMAQHGMSISNIQYVLRHKSPLTTTLYLHRLGALKQDLDSVFGGLSCSLPSSTCGSSNATTGWPKASGTG
jgi:integrase